MNKKYVYSEIGVMNEILFNHFWHRQIKVQEPRITNKTYNSFSKPVTDQSCNQNCSVFYKGKVNKELDKIEFK